MKRKNIDQGKKERHKQNQKLHPVECYARENTTLASYIEGETLNKTKKKNNAEV